MTSDETYLESYLESISTLPSEIRRNLGLLKSLDQSCSVQVKELRHVEESYLKRAQDTIHAIPVESRPRGAKEEEEGHSKTSSSTRTRTSTAAPNPNTPKRNRNEKDASGDDEKDDEERSTAPRDDETIPTNVWAQPPQHGAVLPKPDGSTTLLLPTTEEFRSYVEDPTALLRMALLRRDTRQFQDEKIAVADQTHSLVQEAITRLDADLEAFETLLKGSGQFETVVGRGAPPDALAAIQVTPNSPDWILAKVMEHDMSMGMYKLSDEDIESSKTFTLPESQVVILGGVDRLTRGDVIYAVYPDTTSFYQATVVKPPQKVSGGEAFVMVHFKDDGDEHGITHDKAVLMQHIMRVPYGAIQ